MKKVVDYSKIRGFNYSPFRMSFDNPSAAGYDHEKVDREMGYAEKLNLNSARIFMNYQMYQADPALFLASLKDFIQTAWKHGVSTNPILFMGGFRFSPNEGPRRFNNDDPGLKPLTETIKDPSCWYIGEKYVDEVIAAVGQEEGLLWWDIVNEPDYRDGVVSWTDEEPLYMQDFQERPDMELLRENQEKTWAIVRHFTQYVKEKDPDHDVGVGITYIFEFEQSGLAPLVDVICFHDYFPTRSRLRDVLNMAKDLSAKYGKPLVNNEMCCLCRANPYDMSIELHDEYGIGFYAFELMIDKAGWGRVHGIFYPDGTIRDPSIVAALMGCFRNRTETAIRPDVNQEDYVERVLIMGSRVTKKVRNGFARRRAGTQDDRKDVLEVLEVAEYAANLLEGGELVPMAYPPTAKIEAMRKNEALDVQEALDYMMELLDTLKKACHIIEE